MNTNTHHRQISRYCKAIIACAIACAIQPPAMAAPPLPENPAAPVVLTPADVLAPEFIAGHEARIVYLSAQADDALARLDRAAFVHAGEPAGKPASTNAAPATAEESAFTTDPDQIDWKQTAWAAGAVVISGLAGLYAYDELDPGKTDRSVAEAYARGQRDGLEGNNVQFNQRFVLGGPFTGAARKGVCGTADFVPVLVFGDADQDLSGGFISAGASAETCLPAEQSSITGRWEQVGNNRIKVTTKSGFYNGVYTVDGSSISGGSSGLLLVGSVSVFPAQPVASTAR